MESAFSRQLAEGLGELGLCCGADRLTQLIAFQTLLSKWNKTYNLTAIRDPRKMVSYHLLDSLSVSPYLMGRRVLDIGTGPGLPGIPLSMIHPDKHFILVDCNAKKTRFVRQVMLELELTNVEVVHDRVERFKSKALFDTIVTRAFSAIPEILFSSSHRLTADGRLLAMRGRLPEIEIRYPGFRTTVIPVRVPGIDGERHILMMTPETAKP